MRSTNSSHPTHGGPPPGKRTTIRRLWRARRRLAAVAAVAVILAGCSTTTRPRIHKAYPVVATTTTSAPAICPLTGAPVPGGGPVPSRPALAAKIDNFPDARPQSGVDQADVVFEEPVEGGITRLAAVFLCQQASLIGPVRSARNIDIGILGQLGQPLIVHVGGINPVLANIDHSPIVNIDLGYHGDVIQRVPGRQAPYSTYAGTGALWGLEPGHTTPPAPLFTYSATTLAGTPIATVAIPFSDTANVVWLYDAASATFKRFYGLAPDRQADGVQTSAANVVVQFVHLTYGPWLENSEGGFEVQANLYENAGGPARIYRSGVEITGTWHRSSLGQATQFTDAAGEPIPLAPGPTWVELVPDTVGVRATPAATTTALHHR
jgi:hypothetical protein